MTIKEKVLKKLQGKEPPKIWIAPPSREFCDECCNHIINLTISELKSEVDKMMNEADGSHLRWDLRTLKELEKRLKK